MEICIVLFFHIFSNLFQNPVYFHVIVLTFQIQKKPNGIAQALIHDPDILILDEPTDGLDPNQKHEMRNLIKRISTNKAIVISTHILEEVEAVCSRAVIIANGKLLANDTPKI